MNEMTVNYSYHQQMDENRNISNCNNKEGYFVLSGNKIIQKVDASTMTDPLKIDFRLTSNYDSSNYNDQHEIKEKITFYEDQFNHLNDFTCPECSSKFKNQHSFNNHLEKHKQQFNTCEPNLKKKQHFYRNNKQTINNNDVNNDRPYACNTCCKAFKRNEHLARHMIIHSGNKNEICPECGKAFFRKDHLKKHLQCHNNQPK